MPCRRRVLAPVALCLALTGCGRLGGEVLQSSQNAALPLAAGDVLGQTFAPAGDELVGVDLTTATYGRVPSGTLAVELLDGADGRVLARAEAQGREVADNGWTAFRFESPAPAPERAALEVRWDGAQPVGLYANVPPADDADRGGLQVTAPGAAAAPPLENDPYPRGQILRDGQPATGDLAFRVLGGGGMGGALRTLAGSLGGGLAGLASAPLFAVVWVAALVGAAVLALRGLRPGRTRSAAPTARRAARDPDDPGPAPPARATRRAP